MKITFNSNPQITFGDLSPGDVFIDEHGDLMMKILPGFSMNAVCLKRKNGDHSFPYAYDNGHKVGFMANTELVVKE